MITASSSPVEKPCSPRLCVGSNASYWALVISVALIRNASTFTSRRGASSQSSMGGLSVPIQNVPAGMSTIRGSGRAWKARASRTVSIYRMFVRLVNSTISGM